MKNIQEKDKQYIAGTYVRFDVELVKGKGSLVYDADGKEYIDLNSGIAVNSFGVSDEAWKQAVWEQMNKIQHTSNLYYSDPCVSLAEMLCMRTGAKKVFFSNSGAEANECAIKGARLWGEKNKGKAYYSIVALKNSFHGRTITTLSATGQDVFHEHFYPMTEGFLFAEANHFSEIEKLVQTHPCCGVMLEIVQGEGGVLPLEKEYVKAVYKLCKQQNILLIIDEVQTGNGRSGTLYAYEQFGVKPDIVSTAKGLAGGLPLGATMFFERTKEVWTVGMHGSTFGGNPVCAAGAISILNRIDEKLLQEVREKSQYIIDELRKSEGVVSVSGLGLMLGVEVKGDPIKILASCIKKGVLPIKAKNKIRLLPALNIPWEVLKKGICLLKQAIEENL